MPKVDEQGLALARQRLDQVEQDGTSFMLVTVDKQNIASYVTNDSVEYMLQKLKDVWAKARRTK